MAAGGFVGRVGALAVALGVGAAVATTGPAIAWAEPTSSDSSDSGAESASGPPSGSGPSAASRTGRPNPARIVRDSIKAVTDGVKEGTSRLDRERPTSTPSQRRSDGARTSRGSDGAPNQSDDGANARRATSSSRPTVAPAKPDPPVARSVAPVLNPPPNPPRTVLPSAPRSPRPATASPRVWPSPPADPTAIAPTVGTTSVVSLLLGTIGLDPSAVPNPRVPVNSPLGWVVLGWVRRQGDPTVASRASISSDASPAALVTLLSLGNQGTGSAR